MGIDAVQLSKTVSHALRHAPWLYELELDDDGWVNVEALLAALREESPAWRNLTEPDLAEMIRSSSKQRHELISGRIRALYGHSLPGKLHRTPAAPPTCLFHGTSPVVVAAIQRDGLLPTGRQYVHLSTDRETAIAVGRRKSPEPVILIVKAQAAWQAGLSFYAGNEKVWLADRVPPAFIELHPTTCKLRGTRWPAHLAEGQAAGSTPWGLNSRTRAVSMLGIWGSMSSRVLRAEHWAVRYCRRLVDHLLAVSVRVQAAVGWAVD